MKYRIMKKLASALIIAVTVMLGCKSQTSNGSKGQTTQDAKANAAPVMLTKQMFLDKIMDYEKNPKQWVYKGTLPSIVDFYADWCGPCKITGPILDDLADEYAGKINFYKVNVDQEQELAAVFGIQSIPAFLYIPVNAQPFMSAGIARTPEETKAMFQQQINKILQDSKN